jgi:3,4-dihydroxy 2-butanone 4-phosphate synthase
MQGKVILLYYFDNREKETDIVILSSALTSEMVWLSHKDAGGLICKAISGQATKAF